MTTSRSRIGRPPVRAPDRKISICVHLRAEMLSLVDNLYASLGYAHRPDFLRDALNRLAEKLESAERASQDGAAADQKWPTYLRRINELHPRGDTENLKQIHISLTSTQVSRIDRLLALNDLLPSRNTFVRLAILVLVEEDLPIDFEREIRGKQKKSGRAGQRREDGRLRRDQ